jgi:hypothetical protein
MGVGAMVLLEATDKGAGWAPGRVKLKAKFILEQATKAQRGSTGLALLFL